MDTRSLFDAAAEIDPDLDRSKVSTGRLSSRRIKPTPWNQDLLFRNMANGRISLCNDYPSPLKGKTDDIIQAMGCCRLDYKIRTRSGSASWKYRTPAELADQWRGQRAKINVTDFHFADTPLEEVIDTRPLSRFNLLPSMDSAVNWIEMMTLVISSAGGFSDSHSDDCDGSNHCFTGTKLWLAWDTGEGMDAGLEDLDQQKVAGKCAFDLETWLALDSARWFVINAGETLFMPGHLSHKVITLSPYLGAGSFYLGFPNLHRTLARWQSRAPNWQRLSRRGFADELYPEVIRVSRRKKQQIERTSIANQRRWGLHYLGRHGAQLLG